eukprot:TRINITY_DN17704_c0_g1_i1.p1 TRINITY_DN17704_c0_g1~~TRINITY_DN17704_c0_g1_i1.p1  ORF type:complete len:433 (+),score=14.83 TRINITY_DN17704_c0_g1_i1:167-1300(+)
MSGPAAALSKSITQFNTDQTHGKTVHLFGKPLVSIDLVEGDETSNLCRCPVAWTFESENNPGSRMSSGCNSFDLLESKSTSLSSGQDDIDPLRGFEEQLEVRNDRKNVQERPSTHDFMGRTKFNCNSSARECIKPGEVQRNPVFQGGRSFSFNSALPSVAFSREKDAEEYDQKPLDGAVQILSRQLSTSKSTSQIDDSTPFIPSLITIDGASALLNGRKQIQGERKAQSSWRCAGFNTLGASNNRLLVSQEETLNKAMEVDDSADEIRTQQDWHSPQSGALRDSDQLNSSNDALTNECPVSPEGNQDITDKEKGIKPRSVVERKRRERISKRLTKLKNSLPKSLTRCKDTAGMLDVAVEYIQTLEKQVKELQTERRQ